MVKRWGGDGEEVGGGGERDQLIRQRDKTIIC
jgi:hypothetical protein